MNHRPVSSPNWFRRNKTNFDFPFIFRPNRVHLRLRNEGRESQDVSKIEDEEEEEPGVEFESAPPPRVGEERELGGYGIKKKLLRHGHGWETPAIGDEATGQVSRGLDHGIVTMTKGEIALFTLPSEMGYGVDGCGDVVQSNSVVRFEDELVSWISVLDVSKDGGIIKKVMAKGNKNEVPVNWMKFLYRVELLDGAVVAETSDEGVEFYVKDGYLCPAFAKAIMTMGKGEKSRLIVQPQYAFGEQGRDASERFHPIPPSSVLSIDVELVSFKSVTDVSGDGKVLKKILKEGRGTQIAGEGSTVTISYSARLEDGHVFEKKGIAIEPPFTFVTDEEQVITGLDIATSTMKKGEQGVLTIHPDYGFGNTEVKRDLSVVPPCSTLTYEMEMLDCIKEKEPWKMNNHERVEAAGQKKEEGNLLFQGEKYQRAAKKYDKAVDYVSEELSFGDDELKLAKALRVSCWLNGAACSLKLNDFQGTIKLCSKVLDVELCNVKALYRRAPSLHSN